MRVGEKPILDERRGDWTSILKISRKSLLALCLLALVVTGLTVSLLWGGRGVGPGEPLDAGEEAPVAASGVDGEVVSSGTEPQT